MQPQYDHVLSNQCYNKLSYKGTALYFCKCLFFIFQRTVGLRFLFPVYAIPEVEITPNKHTSGGTIEKGNQSGNIFQGHR